MQSPLRQPRVRAALAGLAILSTAGVLLTDPVRPEQAKLVESSTAQHSLRQITTGAAFRVGTPEGTRVSRGSLKIGEPIGTLDWAGRRWSFSRWTSDWVRPGHGFTELIPSWNAGTPRGTWVQVQARASSTTGKLSSWKTLGSWTSRESGIRRTSSGRQGDAVASVSTDTVQAASGVTLTGYQLRTLLVRKPTSRRTPVVRSVQAVASRLAASPASTSRRALPAKTLAVPAYSQMTHRGQYPQYGGGGQAWCSPTSLSMILAYYAALPSASSYAWVDKSYADPVVDHVARAVYDNGYQGAGNWAFNTAYAATRTTDAFVTRLRDLTEAERFIAAGIPLAASISFGRGELTGAPIGATNGHLVVISGFTRSGRVVVNDPAASSNDSVRRTYARAEFEKVWQRRSGGLVYVVRDAAHPLPARVPGGGW